MTPPSPSEPYVVLLLLREAGALDLARLAAAVGGRALEDARSIAFADGAVATFTLAPGLAHREAVEAAISQTWDWEEAEAAARTAKATCVVALDGMAPGRHALLRRMHALVGAAAQQLEVGALHWRASQRLVHPARWHESVHHGAPVGDHAVNVRLFKVPDGRPGEAILDTMGLGALGLPDLQLRFAGLDPQGLARLLFSYAEYVFEKGNVLDDRALVRGLAPHEEWECRVTRALAPPDREVVEIVPGDGATAR